MYQTQIVINGKTIPVRFGAFVIAKLEEEGIALENLAALIKEKYVTMIAKIIYLGAVNATPGKSGDGISIDDVFDWLDEKGVFSKDVSDISTLFFKQMSDGVPKQTQAGTTSKKK